MNIFQQREQILADLIEACKDHDEDKTNHLLNQLTELEKQADQLNDQIRLLSSIVNGGAITSITQDAEGMQTMRCLLYTSDAADE